MAANRLDERRCADVRGRRRQDARDEALPKGWSARGEIEACDECNAGAAGNGIDNHRAFDRTSGFLPVEHASFGEEADLDRLRA